MTRKELFEHFIAGATWVAPANTADAIEFGDPSREVRRVGVGWSACAANLRAAAADGCDLYITHEPCFCEFWEPEARFRDTDWGKLRTSILNENGMALMALHDTWDIWPKWGIRDSWIAHLGLSEAELLARANYRSLADALGLYRVPETTVEGFARRVAKAIRAFGEEAVFVMGEPDAPVRNVAIGVGCAIPTFEMLALGADLMVVAFDRAFQTITRLPLIDLGANLIVVEHGVTEMPGMQNLARYIEQLFPALSARFYRHEPDSQAVCAKELPLTSEKKR